MSLNPATWMIGLEGLTLTPQECRYLRQFPPKGVILFARNCQTKEQISILLEDVRQQTGQGTWAAIDEEGGRVHRIPFAPFNERPHPAYYGDLAAKNPEQAIQAIFDDAQDTGRDLAAMGFTHNCAPVLDMFHAQGHGIIGQRALSHHKEHIIMLASACVRGFKAAGIEAVGKHFPGHGRANADSHVAVPTVDADLPTLLHEADIFKQVAEQGLQHIMSAHVICCVRCLHFKERFGRMICVCVGQVKASPTLWHPRKHRVAMSCWCVSPVLLLKLMLLLLLRVKHQTR